MFIESLITLIYERKRIVRLEYITKSKFAITVKVIKYTLNLYARTRN